MKVDDLLIILGIIIILIGLLFKFNLKIFPLPGDILIKGENFIFYFPIVTSIILSIILSIIFWFFNKK